jgi:hypothetical protein
MHAAQRTLPATPPVPNVQAPQPVAKQSALDLRRQPLSRCWGP